ncbi:DUF1003 domain-containing protein [Niveispirillum sp. KHB5.9]|uniref:DUF1003 domain-containing protein n=1 Tax=Niveispirillum sp. KHB5.9 TaxID=3400269 RepID=UPI003A845FA8
MNNEIRQLAEQLLSQGDGALTERERRVLSRIAHRRAITRNGHSDYEASMTLGDRLADKVAAVGGSWSFVIGFALVMAVWMVLNAAFWGFAWDPYPFILLNLMLSTLAAVQAPIIMMSQNRQAAKDRAQAEMDYEINLKAELEIMALHEKLDRLRTDELEAMLRQQRDELALLREAIANLSPR